MTTHDLAAVALVTGAAGAMIGGLVLILTARLWRGPFRRARRWTFRWRCARSGHADPKRVDSAIRGQPVRLSVCSKCDTVLSGDVLLPRRIRRAAERRGIDPLELLDR